MGRLTATRQGAIQPRLSLAGWAQDSVIQPDMATAQNLYQFSIRGGGAFVVQLTGSGDQPIGEINEKLSAHSLKSRAFFMARR